MYVILRKMVVSGEKCNVMKNDCNWEIGMECRKKTNNLLVCWVYIVYIKDMD